MEPHLVACGNSSTSAGWSARQRCSHHSSPGNNDIAPNRYLRRPESFEFHTPECIDLSEFHESDSDSVG